MSRVHRSRPYRARLQLPVEIHAPRRMFWTYARDLSVDGLCFPLPVRMGVGDRTGVTLRFPGGFEISLPTEIRWIRREGAGAFLLGTRLAHTAETRRRLDLLMRQIQRGTLEGPHHSTSADAV